MKWRRGFLICAVAVLALTLARGASAAEICDNAIDDDGDMTSLGGLAVDVQQSNNGEPDTEPFTGFNCLDLDCKGDVRCPSKETQRYIFRNADGSPAATPHTITDTEACFNGLDDDMDGFTDCSDADCLGVREKPDANKPTLRSCTESEFELHKYQYCSNGYDDDNDNGIDCADNVSCQRKFGNCGPCPAREDVRHDSCADGRDNDADSTGPGVNVDCRDQDCWKKPLPLVFSENGVNRTWNSEYYRLGFLGDVDTVNENRPLHAAYCSQGEDADRLCRDGFDNDGDGLIDCADPQCVGKTGDEAGHECRDANGESGVADCGDGLDNDSDGLNDCADSGCWDAVGKILGDNNCTRIWNTTDCLEVPHDYPDTTTVSLPAANAADWGGGQPAWYLADANQTVSVRSYDRTHVSSTAPAIKSVDRVYLRGTGVYPSVNILVGSVEQPNRYYPYADPTCAVSDASTGTSAPDFRWRAVSGRAVEVYSIRPVGAFNLVLICPTPTRTGPPDSYTRTGAAAKYYLMGAAVSQDVVGDIDVAEVGDRGEAPPDPDLGPAPGRDAFRTYLYEVTPPDMFRLEPTVGQRSPTGELSVRYGEKTRLRIVPSDDESGICRCRLRLTDPVTMTTFGQATDTVDGNCLTEPIAFEAGGDYPTTFLAEDGVANRGNRTLFPNSELTSQVLTVRVRPAATASLTFATPLTGRLTVFFKKTSPVPRMTVSFTTGTNQTFVDKTCTVRLFDADGQPVDEGIVGTARIPGTVSGDVNVLDCDGDLAFSGRNPWDNSLPNPLTDGTYFLEAAATDNLGNVGTSNRLAVFICNSVPRRDEVSNPDYVERVCAKADFDGDGAPEGTFTYQYSSTPRSCDNCVGIENTDQFDDNGNGIGNLCDGNNARGRCEVDSDIVCHGHSPNFPPSVIDPRSPLEAFGYSAEFGLLLEDMYGPVDKKYCTPQNADRGLCCPEPSYIPVACNTFYGSTSCPGGRGCCPTSVAKEGTQPPAAPASIMGSSGYSGTVAPQACRDAWGLCSVGYSLCFNDADCHYCADPNDENQVGKLDNEPVGCRFDSDCASAFGVPGAKCKTDTGWGTCTIGGAQCRQNSDCDDPAAVCEDALTCENTLIPWLETGYGNWYANSYAEAESEPPLEHANATFCIGTKDYLFNFTSAQCNPYSLPDNSPTEIGQPDETQRYVLPQPDNARRTILGGIDLDRLLDNTRQPLEIAKNADELLDKIKKRRGKQDSPVIVYDPTGQDAARDYVALGNSSAPASNTVLNGDANSSGAVTVIIKGRNLIINDNFNYEVTSIGNLKQLASIAWIVAAEKQADGALKGGNIQISRNVTQVVGAFFSDGSDGIWTVLRDDTSKAKTRILTVRGLMMARKFHFVRTAKSWFLGAEQVIYDGRAVVNPPPGIADLAKTLPLYGGGW